MNSRWQHWPFRPSGTLCFSPSPPSLRPLDTTTQWPSCPQPRSPKTKFLPWLGTTRCSFAWPPCPRLRFTLPSLPDIRGSFFFWEGTATAPGSQAMELFDEIRNVGKRREYPPQGTCRACGKEYARAQSRGVDSGRRRICSTHYNFCDKLVKEGKTTWVGLRDEFPMVTGRGAVTSQRSEFSPSAGSQKLLESEFQNHIVDFVIRTGHGAWMLDPTRKRGVPDIMIIADDDRVLFRELKATGGLVQDHQSALIKRLSGNGQDVGV